MFGEAWKIALSRLQELWMECSFPDWDGYGAPALSQDVFCNALQFVQTIPFVLPQSDGGVSPAGQERANFTVSFFRKWFAL